MATRAACLVAVDAKAVQATEAARQAAATLRAEEEAQRANLEQVDAGRTTAVA